MKKRVVLLTDIPKWVAELNDTLARRGWSVEVLDLTTLVWEASRTSSLSDTLVFNRISANTGGGRISSLTKARDLLASLALTDLPVVNNLRCQLVSSSKALQAAAFCQAGARTPRSRFCQRGEPVQIDKVPQLIKPNVSGFGTGISVAKNEIDSGSYSEDGCAVLQDRVVSGDGMVHRVELLGGKVLYRSATPLAENNYDYCLGEVNQVQLTRDCPLDIAQACERIAQVASMDVGSVEYLLDADRRAWFIDINPVSTYSPRTAEALGFEPLEKLATFLEDRYVG